MPPRHCPSCSTERPEEVTTCPTCGLRDGAGPSRGPLPPGTRLQGGRFTIGRVLGEGGFGITYMGGDPRRACAVAIKEFFPEQCRREGARVVPAGNWTPTAYREAKAQFLHGGRTLAFLNDPSLASVVRLLEENHTAYQVMEFLRGRTLLDLLEEAGGALPEPEALDAAGKVGEALATLHQVGLLHLDVKPENVMATRDGRVVLIDFDGAREFAAGPAVAGPRMVTPGYAPPEQYDRRARVGPYSDVYALAATLYHLLTGRVPISAADRRWVALSPVRQLNPDVSEETSQAVMQGLELATRARPQSARAFLHLLPDRSGSAIRVPAFISRERRLEGHAEPVQTVAFRPPPPGAPLLLASGGGDGAVRLWEVDSGREALCLAGRARPQFSVVSMAGATWAGQARLVEARGRGVGGVTFSPNGRWLAVASADGAVRLWRAVDPSPGSPPHWQETFCLAGHAGGARCVAFSADGRLLASGGDDETVRLWEVGSGQEVARLPLGYWGIVTAVGFCSRGRLLAAASEDRLVRFWDGANGWEEWRLEGHEAPVRAVAFSPAASVRPLLASAGDDQSVRLWDTGNGRELRRLEGHTGPVLALAFSSEGLLATGSADHTARLWNVATGQETRRLTGHTSAVTSLAFSPPNTPGARLLATGSWDLTVRLWEVAG
jgi:WD40 repeat protein